MQTAKNRAIRNVIKQSQARRKGFESYSSLQFSKIFGNVYWEMPERSFSDQESILKTRNKLLEQEKRIQLRHDIKLKKMMSEKIRREMAERMRIETDRRIRKISAYKVKSLKSQVLKNLLKNYSVTTEMRKRRLLALKKKESKLRQKKQELGVVFSRELRRILESAQAKETLYRESNPIRPKLNLKERKEDRKKVFEWLQTQRAEGVFDLKEVFGLKAFLLKHEKVFGEEFEERFDLYKIILALAKS